MVRETEGEIEGQKGRKEREEEMVTGTEERGRCREIRENREIAEQKLRDPGRVSERVLDPAAVPGLKRVEEGDPGACSRSTVKDGARQLWRRSPLLYFLFPHGWP